MSPKRILEDKLLKDLDAHTAHADELAEPLAQELDPLERLKGSVLKYERPLASVWDEHFDLDGCSDDSMNECDQLDDPAS